MTKKVLEETQHWIESFIVELNICPFAYKPLVEDLVRFEVAEADGIDQLYRQLLAELETFYLLPEEKTVTSLFICPQHLESFNEYLNLLDVLEEVIDESGLRGQVQVASFHPCYVFDGEAEDDPANFSNRSPYPMFHFIREAYMEKQLKNFPDVDAIPENNIKKLRELGLENILHRISFKNKQKLRPLQER